jgi:Bacterial membrane protein YfhO
VLALAGFLLFIVLVFSGVLFGPTNRCVGRPEGDARTQFYSWRAYGFNEVSEGRFPLWNPYEFMGMPFVASLQSGMFYPTNWLCAVMPLGLAITLGIVLNLFMSGAFTYLWCRRIGISWVGALIAATAYTFGAPQFLRVFEGHWSFLCGMPWIPLILLCTEALVTSRRLWPIAVGAVAVAMQLFAGNPQFSLYGGTITVLYLLIRFTQERPTASFLRVFLGFGCMYVLGVCLSAVQMLPALELLSHSTRQGQLSYMWISQYSLVPESLVTAVVPDVFGSDVPQKYEYWGRFNLWEMSVYAGIVVLALALMSLGRLGRRVLWPGVILGACLLPFGLWRLIVSPEYFIRDRIRHSPIEIIVFVLACGGWLAFAALARTRRKHLLTILVLGGLALLLALGRYVPLQLFLYHVIPGYDLFRVQARFLILFALFLGVLAGFGIDGFLKRRQTPDGPELPSPRSANRLLWIGGSLGALLIIVGGLLLLGGGAVRGSWIALVDFLMRTGAESRFYLAALGKEGVSAEFKLDAMQVAGASALRGGLLLLVACGGLALAIARPRWRNIAVAIVIIAVAFDAFSFSRRYIQSFDIADMGLTPKSVAFLKKGDQPVRYGRALHHRLPPGEGMIHGLSNIEGVQPNAPGLFRDVFWRFQGRSEMTQTTSYILSNPNGIRWRLFTMLNLKYLVRYSERPPLNIVGGQNNVYSDGKISIDELPNPWPRAWLVHKARIVPKWGRGLTPEHRNKILADYSRENKVRFDSAGAQKATALNELERLPFRTTALFEEEPNLALAPAVADERMPRITKYVSNHVVIEAEPLSDGLLILADMDYPGWYVTVDDKPAELLRVNYLMRGVALSAGKHKVEFHYAPNSFRIGGFASLAAVLVVMGLLLADRARRRRECSPIEENDGQAGSE